MFAVSLIFSGIAMFLNGFLPLIDENDNNEITIMNVLSGIIISVLSIFGILFAVDNATYPKYASLLLFGVTHLFISAIGIWKFSEESLGWFSAFLAILALALGLYYIFSGSMLLGVMWIIWMFIWLFYFLSRSLDVLHTVSCWVIMLIGAIGLCGAGALVLTNILTFTFI